MSQLVERRLTLGFGSGHDLVVREIRPHVGLCADSVEPAWDSLSLCLSVSLSLSLSPPLSLPLSCLSSLCASLSLSLSQNKIKTKTKHIYLVH